MNFLDELDKARRKMMMRPRQSAASEFHGGIKSPEPVVDEMTLLGRKILSIPRPSVIAEMNAPKPADVLPPERQVKVRVVDGFYVRGEPAEPGMVVLLDASDAAAMAALGKAELLR